MERMREGSCPCSSPPPHFLPDHQEPHHHSIDPPAGGAANEFGGFVFPSQVATLLPWTLNPSLHSSTITTATTINYSAGGSSPTHHDRSSVYSGPQLLPPPPPPLLAPPSSPHLYGDLHTRRTAAAASSFQFGYDGGLMPQDPLGLAGLYMASGGGGPEAYFRGGGGMSSPFGSLQSEFGKMTAQEIMDAKALAASKSHSEAERRRRERINNHLARLRSLLPSTTKTDKASLLAEVIQHVKELKRQTSQIVEAESPVPTESDELTVDATSDEDGRFVVKASMCCDDRSDLLTELIKALKTLRLRALKAEITTLGGRVKNVLVVTGEDGRDVSPQDHQHCSVNSIQEALKAVMERPTTASDDHRPSSTTPASNSAAGTSSSAGVKRQRTTTTLSSILENSSI